MSLFTRSLWPEHVRAPYRRLIIALVAAPLGVSAGLTLTAFVLAGLSEKNADAVISVTIDSGIALSILVLGFMVTFGLVGVAVLWALSQRGMLAWVTTGLLGGGIAGLLFGTLAMQDFQRGLLAIFAITGMVLFVLVRLIAGIQRESSVD